MKSFQQWSELNYSTTLARQDINADRQNYGTAWMGPQEVKDLIELLAKYDPNGAQQVVAKIKTEITPLLNAKSSAIQDPNELERAKSLTRTLRTDMGRFINKAKQVQGENQ